MGWFAAAIGRTSAVFGIFGAKQQKDVDKQQTELAYNDNLEKIRRREFEQRQTLGTAKAVSQAAGVLHTGGSTAQGVINTMAREFKTELDWMTKFAATARKLGHKRASVAHQTNVMRSISGGIQTGTSIYGAV